MSTIRAPSRHVLLMAKAYAAITTITPDSLHPNVVNHSSLFLVNNCICPLSM